MILEIDLIPRACWHKNVRSQLDPTDWFSLIELVSSRSRNYCQICGGRGLEWPVECHEQWERHKIDNGIWQQTLVGLQALCPKCHLVKHYGRARAIGREKEAFTHLGDVNNISGGLAITYIAGCFSKWRLQNKYEWQVDLSFLDKLGLKYKPII